MGAGQLDIVPAGGQVSGERHGLFRSEQGQALAAGIIDGGFHCMPGAEGVGRAATASFVYSFVMILVLDLFVGITLDNLYFQLWPEGAKLF